jgi:hypothetical protein
MQGFAGVRCEQEKDLELELDLEQEEGRPHEQ